MKHRRRFFIGSLMMVVLAMALALLAAGGQGAQATDGIIYVDTDALGANNGSSWADAFTTLQPALDAAVPGSQIWVAEGTYKPTVKYGGTLERYRSFQMKNYVAIYGGFAGDEGIRAERDWVGNLTILSGDIGIPGDSSDNAYHVFYHRDGPDLDRTAILDGFTISGGNAEGSWSIGDSGGGMHNAYSSPTLRNCTFADNRAENQGGGMFNVGSSPMLINCTFADNRAELMGGGMANQHYSAPVLTNCTFKENVAWERGGGMCNVYSSPLLTNCTFAGNSTGLFDGGGMHNRYSSPKLVNSTFRQNRAGFAGVGGAMCNTNGSNPILVNCTLTRNFVGPYGATGGIYNSDSSPTLTNCILWGDELPEIYNSNSSANVSFSDVQGGCTGTGNINLDPLLLGPYSGDVHLKLGSPCIDAGSNAAPDLPDHDFEGDTRVIDGDAGGTATVDMGVDEVLIHVYLPLVLRNH